MTGREVAVALHHGKSALTKKALYVKRRIQAKHLRARNGAPVLTAGILSLTARSERFTVLAPPVWLLGYGRGRWI